MDARHKFIISTLADAVGLEETQIEDFVLVDEKFSLMDEFFAQNGTRKLMFFYQEGLVSIPMS